jgi:hypothetical protein
MGVFDHSHRDRRRAEFDPMRFAVALLGEVGLLSLAIFVLAEVSR